MDRENENMDGPESGNIRRLRKASVTENYEHDQLLSTMTHSQFAALKASSYVDTASKQGSGRLVLTNSRRATRSPSRAFGSGRLGTAELERTGSDEHQFQREDSSSHAIDSPPTLTQEYVQVSRQASSDVAPSSFQSSKGVSLQPVIVRSQTEIKSSGSRSSHNKDADADPESLRMPAFRKIASVAHGAGAIEDDLFDYTKTASDYSEELTILFEELWSVLAAEQPPSEVQPGNFLTSGQRRRAYESELVRQEIRSLVSKLRAMRSENEKFSQLVSVRRNITNRKKEIESLKAKQAVSLQENKEKKQQLEQLQTETRARMRKIESVYELRIETLQDELVTARDEFRLIAPREEIAREGAQAVQAEVEVLSKAQKALEAAIGVLRNNLLHEHHERRRLKAEISQALHELGSEPEEWEVALASVEKEFNELNTSLETGASTAPQTDDGLEYDAKYDDMQDISGGATFQDTSRNTSAGSVPAPHVQIRERMQSDGALALKSTGSNEILSLMQELDFRQNKLLQESRTPQEIPKRSQSIKHPFHFRKPAPPPRSSRLKSDTSVPPLDRSASTGRKAASSKSTPISTEDDSTVQISKALEELRSANEAQRGRLEEYNTLVLELTKKLLATRTELHTEESNVLQLQSQLEQAKATVVRESKHSKA
mmetsp:Transcript_6590/g.11771  ORF Transcript_6590/g.11771 Transcript_6590/m.11771 type:complete len:659 (-) Transcript_6590:71-2047(-)